MPWKPLSGKGFCRIVRMVSGKGIPFYQCISYIDRARKNEEYNLKFIADLHIHSRFSRATARNLNLPMLDYWAARKGLTVIGTGDFTHPQWREEISGQMVEAEDGLYRLCPELALNGGGETRFVLTAEISNIYKKDGRVRKNHNLILMPDLAAASRLSERLERIGNVKSDGRPILGLDARDLLELTLDTCPEAFFIPAHIWTPWFSLLGSKSGFDSLEECFGDLTPHIHALETGLSSDPAMNWRLSGLDPYVLVSNSDAHSPDKLGREANLFDTELSYPAMVRAMKKQGGFEGTLEFFPEEGKYHMDGHRSCGCCLEPEETRARNGLCPVCGKPVTVGVMYRVLELADREPGVRPDGSAPYFSLIPLTEVMGEVLGVGPKSKKVQQCYEEALTRLGPELFILRDCPVEDITGVGGELLGLAVERMRQGKVLAHGGYDGEYGRIGLFEPGEKEILTGQKTLFAVSSARKTRRRPEDSRLALEQNTPALETSADVPLLLPQDPLLDDLNPEQRRAVVHPGGPLCIVAGPGTGKTTVLTRRAAWLVREGLAGPDDILAVTFTRQAAAEMASRLAFHLPFRPAVRSLPVMTFHALGLKIITEAAGREIKVLDEDERLAAAGLVVEGSPYKAKELVGLISLAKQNLRGPGDQTDPELAAAFGRYEVRLASLGAVDYDDLLQRSVALLESQPDLLERCGLRRNWILVDEYQDINLAQYTLTRLLAPGESPNLTVIGDPDQAIYGFRGADAAYFRRFREDYPAALLVSQSRNYRSTEAILKAAGQVIANNTDKDRPKLAAHREGPAKVTTAVLDTPGAEAEFVVSRIEKLLGGTGFFALDSGRAESGRESGLSLGDVAVLYRLHALAGPLAEALSRAGLPFQQAGQEPLRETDGLDFKAEKISLLTMHAAKGLEFEIVFVIGLEEGVLPYLPPNKPPADTEEERRLFYVAMTRAKRQLFLTHTRHRTLFGKKLKPSPSLFLTEIDRRLKLLDKLPERRPNKKVEQLDLF